MKKSYSLIVILSILLLSFVLNAQNLIANGAFDQNIDGWNYNSNNASWISDDGASISGDGCFRFGKILNNNAFRYSASERMVVMPGHTYQIGLSAKTPADSATNSYGVIIYWYDSDENEISQSYIFNEMDPIIDDVWHNLYGALKAPENSVSAIMWLTLEVGGMGSPDEAYVLWDDIFVLNDTIFDSSFE